MSLVPKQKQYGISDSKSDGPSRAIALSSDIEKVRERVKNPVIALEEDDYMEKLSFFITRDFFPDLHQFLKEKQRNAYGISEQDLMDDKLKKMTLRRFMRDYSSEDNVSFQKL